MTNTSIQPSADSARGVLLWVRAESDRDDCAALLALVAVLEAPRVVAPSATGGGGRPIAVPVNVMLLTPRTAVAPIRMLCPAMPASFAFTAPFGASRVMSPATFPGVVVNA